MKHPGLINKVIKDKNDFFNGQKKVLPKHKLLLKNILLEDSKAQ